MLFERVVPFLGTHYQKHWKNPEQLDIFEISLNKSLFKIMINFNFSSTWFSMFSVVWCFAFMEMNKVEVESPHFIC